MELLMDPSIWAGLLTLIVLEIVLGIDNFGVYCHPGGQTAAEAAR